MMMDDAKSTITLCNSGQSVVDFDDDFLKSVSQYIYNKFIPVLQLQIGRAQATIQR